MRKIILRCDKLGFSLLESFVPKEKVFEYIKRGYDKFEGKHSFELDISGNKAIVIFDKDGLVGECSIKIQDE